MGQLKGWSIQGLEGGLATLFPFRTDVILSSSSLDRLSWQPKKGCAHPTVLTAQLKRKTCSFFSFLKECLQIKPCDLPLADYNRLKMRLLPYR